MSAMRVFAPALLVLALAGGCTTVPKMLRDIDISGREKSCVNRCLGIFNACAGDSGIGGGPPYQIEGCKRSYRACLDNNCPDVNTFGQPAQSSAPQSN